MVSKTINSLRREFRPLVLKCMPYFVMSYYFMEVLYSAVNTPLVGRERAIVMDVNEVFGHFYTSFDVLLTIGAIILILGTRKEASGVTLLLIGRVVHRLFFSIWTMFFYFLFNDSLDVGSLLLLMAAKINLREQRDWFQSKYHLLLLGGRVGLCSLFIIWMDEGVETVFSIVSFGLLVFISLGFHCKLFAFLAVVALLYHDVFSNHWSMLWGWNDTLLSIQYFSLLFCKIGGFLMLSQLGGGWWSVDGYRNRNGGKWQKKGNYRIIKTQTSA
ncbi:uncharacterized protein T02E1.7 [Drosophila yakuba]|uniref:Uncharacterized protein n=1 Tax=Drosophila yakuba TaxID=7245 RepID=B4P137_DROYA|nr:uncharacterized protein T02E1.7 [Drosophila yakuba]EDW88012.1 uncharacterized protein Dyak_GE13186 [Drosophila yakuba]